FGLRAQHLSGFMPSTPALSVTGAAANFDPVFDQRISEFKVGLNYKMTPAGFGARPVSPMYTKAPIASGYDWSGVYVGAHVGGGWQNVAFSDPSAMPVLTNCCLSLGNQGNPTALPDGNGSGFLAGVQAGLAYQLGRLVVGGEVDFSAADIKSNS